MYVCVYAYLVFLGNCFLCVCLVICFSCCCCCKTSKPRPPSPTTPLFCCLSNYVVYFIFSFLNYRPKYKINSLYFVAVEIYRLIFSLFSFSSSSNINRFLKFVFFCCCRKRKKFTRFAYFIKSNKREKEGGKKDEKRLTIC